MPVPTRNDFVVHQCFNLLWNIAGQDSIELSAFSVDNLQNVDFCGMIFITQLFGKQNIITPIKIDVLSAHFQDRIGTERVCHEKAALPGEKSPGEIGIDQYFEFAAKQDWQRLLKNHQQNDPINQ